MYTFTPPPGGIGNFRIHGQVFRQMGPLLTAEGTAPSCLQTYFYDLEEQLRRRLEVLRPQPHQEEKDKAVFELLQRTLPEVNTYLQSFKNIHQIVQCGEVPKDIYIAIHADKKPQEEHARRYNLPSSSEVAILLPNEPRSTESRTIVCALQASRRDRGLQFFKETHRSYDPLSYPLLFPYGTDGFHLGIHHQRGPKDVTAMEFYAYRLMQRGPTPGILHSSCKLYQQYIVDMYAKIEAGRLNYLRFHQEGLRRELYKGLKDAVHAGDAQRAGKRIILPASFTGGPRFMAMHYHDAMAIVRKFGKPTFFITFTCNAQWCEIVSQLRQNQTASDRPDLTARVFRLKQQQLLADIKAGVLGPYLAHVCTVEFQKRGLPHCHFLFIMRGEQHTWQDVDKVVCAEIPDPNNPHTKTLHEHVMKFMIHGPCGVDNPHSPCMTNGECCKNFPKSFNAQTRIGEDTYPLYRRRHPEQGGHTGTLTKANKANRVDNRHVVPYNPWLLLRYKSHINVEYCASIKAVKYLYKYIFKGSDQATVSFEVDTDQVQVKGSESDQATVSLGVDTDHVQVAVKEQEDEIKSYESCRFIGASEAAWRILGFTTQERYPAVECLPIHLPDQQSVTFNPSDPTKALETAADTKLTAYFEQNNNDPHARTILYCDFPQHYTWNKWGKSWKRRTVEPGHKLRTIGRVFTVHPNQGETFYLRLLLHHKPGATSFENLRTVGETTCTTFKEACIQLNLLQDDNEWQQCLSEAGQTQSAAAIRGLFVSILLFCEPSDPLKLYTDHLSQLMEDFTYRRLQQRLSPNAAENAAQNDLLCDLDERLQQHEKTTEDYGLPAADRSQRNRLDLTVDELDPDAQSTYSERICLLNEDQARAFHVIKEKIDSKSGGLIFIDAPGGNITVLPYVVSLLYE